MRPAASHLGRAWPDRRVERAHIRSGAETPSSDKPLATTVRVASTSSSRRGMQRGDFFVSLGQHHAGVVEAVEGRRHSLLEVARDPVRGPQLGCARDDPRKFAQRPQQVTLAVVASAVRRRPCRDRTRRRRPRHPGEFRLVRAWTYCTYQTGLSMCASRGCRDRDRAANPIESAYQRIARGIDTDRLDEVVQGDEIAGPLAHLDRFAVLRNRLTNCPIRTSSVSSGSSPKAAAIARNRPT